VREALGVQEGRKVAKSGYHPRKNGGGCEGSVGKANGFDENVARVVEEGVRGQDAIEFLGQGAFGKWPYSHSSTTRCTKRREEGSWGGEITLFAPREEKIAIGDKSRTRKKEKEKMMRSL